MAFLPQGSSAQVAISAGQSIAVGAVRGGTANVTYPVGYPKGPSDTVVNGTETFGPFATATTVTVYAAQGIAEYVTGTSPVCTDGPVALATDPLTGVATGLNDPAGGTIRTSKINRRQTTQTALIPNMPASVATLTTLTQTVMMTAPGDFEAVAMVAINIDTSTMTIDNACVGVSERSDTSKTVPTVNGSTYNVLSAAGTQNGFSLVTWDGGSASVTVSAAASAKQPVFKISDWIPLSSIPRVDDSTKFPLVIVRQYIAARTNSAFVFPTAAAVDDWNTAFAPYEWYQTAQAVDGVSVPANYTTTWSAGANTQTMRIFGLAFRLRGMAETVFFCGDSLMQGLGGAGDTVSNVAANRLYSWATRSMLAMASKTKPVGFVNAGIGGSTSTEYLAVATGAIPVIKPTIAVYPVVSPNDAPSTVAAISGSFNRAMTFVDLCDTNKALPMFVNTMPTGSYASLAARLAVDTKVNNMIDIQSVNTSTTLTDSTNAAQSYWKTAYYLDGTHPNNAGYLAAYAAALPALQKIVAW